MEIPYAFIGGAAVVDSINPFAIGALLLLVGTMREWGVQERRIGWMGMAYIGAVFVTYMVVGVGLVEVLVLTDISDGVLAVIGGLVVVVGMDQALEYWDIDLFFVKVSQKQEARIQHYVEQASVYASALLGSVVALVELPATGGPYLAVSALLADGGLSPSAFAVLAGYNVIIVAPLLGIFALLGIGMEQHVFQEWVDRHERVLDLATGAFMMVLGAGLIVWAV